MSLLEWLAATLLLLFVAISVVVLVAHLRRPDGRINAETGWLVFDVVFGVTALAMVVADVDGAFYVLLSVFVLRRLAERRFGNRPEAVSSDRVRAAE